LENKGTKTKELMKLRELTEEQKIEQAFSIYNGGKI